MLVRRTLAPAHVAAIALSAGVLFLGGTWLGPSTGVLAPGVAAAQTSPPPVSVYPSPGTRYNLPGTQIAFRGIPAGQIGSVTVTGSVTGSHPGRIEADSDGDGGSFLPNAPFAPGEVVTVTTGLNIVDGTNGTFTFTIEHPSRPIKPMPLLLVKAASGGLQYFRSRPDLSPPSVVVTKNSAPASQGDIFVAPQYGPTQNGPMILDPQGHLLWFLPFPVSRNMLVTDFRVQTLGTQPVLTWWQGTTNNGSGEGEGVIWNNDYQQIAVVHAANGLQMDLHEFLITPQGQAYVIAASPVSLPGVPHKPVMDSVVQEIDIKTGLVLFEWHALDHIPLSDSYVTPSSPGFVFDPYHANSVGVEPDGNLVVSLRDTSAVYEIDRSTGQVLWSLGGKASSFKMGPGTTTAFQHDAVVQPNGTVTIFDDGAGPPTVHPYSRGIDVSLNTKLMTASLVKQYTHSPELSANFEGNLQTLSGGDVFLGWGQQPYFSEDNAAGQEIFDAHFGEPTGTYRAYRFPWSAQPSTLPAIAVGPGSAGTTDVFASWNGATDVASWQVLAGPSARALTPVARESRSNFETTIAAASQAPLFAVQALGSSGHVLSTSSPSAAPPHVALYGRSVFVSHASTGAIPATCFAKQNCHISTTVSAGSTVIATTGPELVPAGGGGNLYFTLSATGRKLLDRARGNRLAVEVAAKDSSGLSTTSNVDLISFGTSGTGPRRSISQPPTLRFASTSDFVSSTGTGGILAGCFASAPCPVTTTVSVGSTVIATTKPEVLGEGSLGYLIFSLTPAGQSLLAHAPGNQLAATVKLASGSATATASLALVRFR